LPGGRSVLAEDVGVTPAEGDHGQTKVGLAPRIRSATWDAVSELYEYYQVNLHGGRVDDGTLKELSPSLACYRILDLNLDQCPITDEGLESLADLENLARIHLHGTRVSRAVIARLKDRLPGVVVEMLPQWPIHRKRELRDNLSH
jgi:hypothetical protein